MTTGEWLQLIAIGVAAVGVGLFLSVNVIKPIVRRWLLRAPCEAHFTILSLHDVVLDYLLQDDTAHHVKELVLPSNREVEIEIEYLPRLKFQENELSFGCEGESKDKPVPTEHFDRVVSIGRNSWKPGEEGHWTDRHGYLHIKRERKRTRGQRVQLGLKLKTGAPGLFLANIFFFSEEVVGKCQLTIRVEDKPRSLMRCSLHHGCFVRPLIAQS